MPALIRKIHEAKLNNSPSVVIWGTGEPLREFLHADDLADACYFLIQNYSDHGFVNIGVGEDISIKNLAILIKKIVGYEGKIEHDYTKPDGTPRKLMDVGKLTALGWKAKTSLEEGITKVYEEFVAAEV